MAEIALSAPPPRLAARRRRARVLRLQVATVLVVWILWEALAWSGLLYEGVVPSSFRVFASMGRHLVSAEFYGHLARTAWEVAAGFVIGGAAGFGVGVCFGIWPFAGRAGEPWLNWLAPTPKIIFLPIMMVLFGIGAGSKIAMASISCFFPVALAVLAGTRLVDPVFLRVMQTLKASRWQTVRMVYLPALVPFLLTGARLGLGVAIVGALLAEIKLSNRGLGFLAIQHYNFFQTHDMYAVLIIIFILAVAVNAGMERVARRYA